MKKETDIARPVVAWLEEMGWEVHKEVTLYQGGGRADIVGRLGRLTWVVETKTSLTRSLLAQAYHWLWHSNYISIATPWRVRRDVFTTASLQHWGIGWLTVGEEVHQNIPPRLHRIRIFNLLDSLNEGTRTWAEAGNSTHEYWSPFRETCQEVLRAVKEKPGMTTRELFETVKHHYANDQSARSAMLHWVRAGKIPGVETRGNKRYTWWPVNGE